MTDLQTLAAKAVNDADPNHPAGVRIHATGLLRAATGLSLRESVQAVDAALAAQRTFAALARFGKKVPTGWRYDFPNGRSVSVINDWHTPFRFEVLSDDPADAGTRGVASGLTSEQVERKLATIYALPTQG